MKGKLPGPLAHHTTALWEDKMYLFGGLKPNGQTNKDLYCFDVRSSTWTIERPKGDVPSECDEHSSCLTTNSFIIFGGFHRGTRTNNLYEYSFEDKVWTKLPSPTVAPCPRAGASITFTDGILFVFGGKDEDNARLNDIWQYHLQD